MTRTQPARTAAYPPALTTLRALIDDDDYRGVFAYLRGYASTATAEDLQALILQVNRP